MATIKEKASELETLVEGLSQPGIFDMNGSRDCMPEELEQEPLFEIDYDKVENSAKTDAKESLMILIKAAIPEKFHGLKIVYEKIRMDAHVLGEFYNQLKLAKEMQKTQIETVRSGATSPRMYEVYNQTCAEIQKLLSEITKYQVEMRKGYIDLIVDLNNKEQLDLEKKTDLIAQENVKGEETLKIEGDVDAKEQGTSSSQQKSNIFMGTKNMLLSLKEKIQAEKLAMQNTRDSEPEVI